MQVAYHNSSNILKWCIFNQVLQTRKFTFMMKKNKIIGRECQKTYVSKQSPPLLFIQEIRDAKSIQTPKN